MRVSTHPTDTDAPLIVERSAEEKRFNLVLVGASLLSIAVLVGVLAWSMA